MLLEGMQLGRYRLVKLIGRGGMGEVYLADDARMPRQVAIKVIQTEVVGYPDKQATEDAARLFQREMRVIIALEHPHILPLYDYGEEVLHKTTITYMVMPLVKEGSLSDWLQERGTSELLSVQDVAALIEQAADALQHAHDHQIVHQDVKPSNFLIRTRKERPHRPDLLLVDFGIAKFTNATATASQTVRGTPAYMAPEQWDGQPIAASDQYALAIMAYLLLTGQVPFQGGQGQVMRQHFTVDPQPPSTLRPQLSPAIDAVLLRALAKSSEDRFPSISAFAQAFQQAAQGASEPTIVKTTRTLPSRPLFAILAISKSEAQNGSHRTLTLPDGQQVTVQVPAGAYDGQVLRLEDGAAGPLMITLSVKETEPTFLPSTPSQSFDKTVRSSNPSIPVEPALQANRSNQDTVVAIPHTSASESAEGRPIIIRQQGIPISTAILLVALAVLLVVGGLFFYIQGNNHSGTSTSNTTATTVTPANSSNASPSTQSNSSSITATAQTQSTDVAATTQTNKANATATVANAHTFPPPNASLVLNDPLSDNSQGHGWETKPDAGGVCQFIGGTYQVNERQYDTREYCPAYNTSFSSNFAYEVQMTIVEGDLAGLIVQDATNQVSYYFRFSQNGQYDFTYYEQVVSGPLATGTASSFRTGLNQSNLLQVIVMSNSIQLFVNNQFVTSVGVRAPYGQGYIGVFVKDRGNATEAIFTNAKVWTF